MARLSNMAYAQTLEGFKEALSAGTVTEDMVVFIEDVYQLWTHGKYFQFDSVS